MELKNLYRISDYEWHIPRSGNMNTDVFIIASKQLITEMDDQIYQQAVNAASLPGYSNRMIILPNAYPAIGFPEGCVSVFKMDEGVVCPTAIDADINKGIRVITTNLIYQDIEKKTASVIQEFYKAIPIGEKSRGKFTLTKKEMMDMLSEGTKWIIYNREMGKEDDIDYIEDAGGVDNADPEAVDPEVIKLEKGRLGVLGQGDNFIEMQIVEEIFDIERARVYGLFKNQVVVTFQAGSLGIGKSVTSDYNKLFAKVAKKYGVSPDSKELAAVPINSPECQQYLAAYRCACNFAFVNRQVINHFINLVFNEVIKDVDTNIMYDIGLNTIQIETHRMGTSYQRVLVHRKNSTRNFPGKMSEIPRPYRVSGQPVIVKGALGNYSYIMAGTEDALIKTFGSGVPNVGRVMSEKDARRKFNYNKIMKELKEKGIYLKAKSRETVLSDAPEAYKDIESVVKTVNKPNISTRVARLKPIGIIKA